MPEMMLNMIYPELSSFLPPAGIVQVQPQNNIQVINGTEVMINAENQEYQFCVIGNHEISNTEITNIKNIQINNIITSNQTFISIELYARQEISSITLYFESTIASKAMNMIFRESRNIDIYTQDMKYAGSMQILIPEEIYPNEFSTPYYHLYNYSVLPELYQFTSIKFANKIKDTYIFLIPVYEAVDINILHIKNNLIPIINLYTKTSDPIKIDIPAQSYQITINNRAIHSIPKISILDPKTNHINTYQQNSKTYFTSSQNRIFMSNIRIQWSELTGKIMHANLLCSDIINNAHISKIIIKNLNAKCRFIVLRPDLRKFTHNNHWLIYNILTENINMLDAEKLLNHIQSISNIYSINIDFSRLEIFNTHYLHTSKLGFSTIRPKKIIQITIDSYMQNFIIYILWAETLIQVSGLDYILEIRFIDQNSNTILRYSENNID